MAFESDALTGNCWKNDYKDNEKKPDYKSSKPVVIHGKEYDVALWERKDKNGKVYFGFKLSDHYVKPEAKQEPVNDEVPF